MPCHLDGPRNRKSKYVGEHSICSRIIYAYAMGIRADIESAPTSIFIAFVISKMVYVLRTVEDAGPYNYVFLIAITPPINCNFQTVA